MKRWLAALTVLAAAAALAALTAGAAPQAPDLAYVNAQVKQLKAIPRFIPPGPAFDASKARGKTMFLIPLGSQIPFNKVIEASMRRIAKDAGLKYIYYPD